MLNIIEEKLLLMKKMTEVVKEQNLSEDEIRDLNNKINNLEYQVRALDEESVKIDDNIEY